MNENNQSLKGQGQPPFLPFFSEYKVRAGDYDLGIPGMSFYSWCVALAETGETEQEKTREDIWRKFIESERNDLTPDILNTHTFHFFGFRVFARHKEVEEVQPA